MKRVQKSLKNVEKYFQPQFWKIRHARNIKKIRPNERGGQTHLLHIYIFCFLRMPPPPKSIPNKVIIPFYPIFAPIKLKKGVIFDISRLDLRSIWLFDTFNMPFLYIG